MTRPSALRLPVLPVLFLFVTPVVLPVRSLCQAPAAQAGSSPGTTANTRACSANPILAPSDKSKSAKKSKYPLPPEPLPACLEMKGEPIEIQEFLQTAVRELQWRIGENHASEDSWNFVRYLNEEELAKYGDTKVLIEPVEFTSGKAAITIRTTELAEGYARVQIATNFQGEGKSTDKVWAQPGNSWPLRSTGVLEQELISALQKRYKPTE
jgi:hypothetical protein